ncbi:CHAT domain-containing protein [Mariniflexile fucanivorans]|uniref:CHAT domain-containing protein n=1 Tax=Mariniflexile fucanivorans TaxID=264023 RepID=A0A4R1RQP1_9FLAO|nr:CHAT domain-containing protein [Mariniflexile fucanivorans]TCL68728.1 CHAT domain-containing protein [Mariniflexile fucanivorans]
MKYLVMLLICIVSCFPCVNAQSAEVEQMYGKAIHYHYTNKDSAYYYYKNTISLADKKNELEYVLSAYLYLMNANGYYYDLKNYQKNLKKEDSLLRHDARFKSLTNINYYKDYLLFDKGNYHYKIKDYTTSKTHFQELFTKLNKIPENKRTRNDLSTLSSLYSFLGVIYKHTGKYELAEYNLKKEMEFVTISKDSIEEWESSIMNSKKLLSQVYEDKKDFKAANLLLTEALSFYKSKIKDPSYKNRILSTYLLLAKNYIQQNEFQLAIETLNESARFYSEDNPFSREVDLIYGDAYLGLKNYSKAVDYYRDGLSKIKKYREYQKHQDIAIGYAKLGNVFIKQQKISEGLEHYQMALIQLEKKFDDLNYNSNPNPEKALSKKVLVTILREKQNALFEAYTITKNIEYLKKANKTSKAIIKTLDVLRPEFESKLDKEFLVNETYPSIQTMVRISYELYKKSNDSRYIDDAFYFMEKSKSIALLEAHRNAEATKYGNIPNQIISEEQIYRAKIAHLDEEIFNSNLKEKSVFVDSLFATKKKYYEYIAKIEQDFPKYYGLKYKSSVISAAELKGELKANQSVFSYLVTEDAIYLTVLAKNKDAFYKFKFNETLKNTISDFYRQLSKPNIDDRTAYSKNSHLIYNAILKPALQNSKTTDIVILADDVLNYIPFDVLQTDVNNQQSYLLSKYSISYASSATLLQEQNKTKVKGRNKLMVFAPHFNETISEKKGNAERFDMSPLVYNGEEAKNISAYFKGSIYDGKRASIANFKNDLSGFNLIHFATHASANDEFPDYSYLAFEDIDESSNLLYVKDLYNYQIDADMVTLSACQTGFGKLQKGEGMLSLARGFNYAGVPSIVTTLWKINDRSTSEIMKSFYKNLSDGLSKKEALRQAKLSYLNANDDALLRHPYYWSGIVITGNTMPLNNTSYVLWVILALGGLLFLWLVYKKLFKLIK